MRYCTLLFVSLLVFISSCENEPDLPPETTLNIFNFGGASYFGAATNTAENTLIPVSVLTPKGLWQYSLLRFSKGGKLIGKTSSSSNPSDSRFASEVLDNQGRLFIVGSMAGKPAFFFNDTNAFSASGVTLNSQEGYMNHVIQWGAEFYATGIIKDANNDANVFVCKISNGGSILASKVYGTSANDGGISLATDGNKLMLLAHSYGTGLGDRDFWLLELNTDLDSIQSKVLGGSGYDQPASIQFVDNHFWLSGHSTSLGNGTHDALLIKMKADMSVVWQKYYNYGGHEGVDAMAFLSNGNIGLVSYGDMNIQSGFYLEVNREGNAQYIKRYPDIAGFKHIAEDGDRRVFWGSTRGPNLDIARVSDVFPN